MEQTLTDQTNAQKILKQPSTKFLENNGSKDQKQPFRGILGKRYSENMKQIYKRPPMQKCVFNKIGNQLY